MEINSVSYAKEHRKTQSCTSGHWIGFNFCTVTTAPSCHVSFTCQIAGCFLAGTTVETPDGPVVIEELEVGDKVIGADDEGRTVVNAVVRPYRAVGSGYYVINGDTEVTGTHPFL